MNIQLLKQLGNIDQIAGIRESQLLRGRGEQVQIAEFYNAAGLRFTVVPDLCMDLYDLSYKGVNLSFQSKNGIVSPQAFSPSDGEFCEQWPAGMLVTCGLDNVGLHSSQEDGEYPTHGRTAFIPAKNFGTRTYWDQDRYLLQATGEMHHTKLYSRHLSVQRTIETELNAKSLTIHDVITNFEVEDEPIMLLYHFNFGYPMLQPDSIVKLPTCRVTPMNDVSTDPEHMLAPEDGRGEEMYVCTEMGNRACGVIYNPTLELGAYVAFDTANLPNMLEWKNMKSHDYVLALEPCNTCCLNRTDALAQDKIAILPAYSALETSLELGVLDGMTEIREFLKNL